MPPEQAQANNAALGPRSDVFALGGVLYFALTGQPLYGSGRWSEILEKAQRGEWKREELTRHNVPRTLRAICERALEVDPEKRFATADQFADRLEHFVRQPTQSRRIFLMAGGGASVAGLFVLPYWFKGQTEPVEPTSAVMVPASLKIEVLDSRRFLQLSDATPLKSGDKVRIRASIPDDYWATLFLIASDGTWQELTNVIPWQIGKNPNTERLQFPREESMAVPIRGRAGTEVVVLCGWPQKPIDLSELSDIARNSAPWPQLPDMTVLRADSSGVFVMQRGRDFGPAVHAPDAERLVRERLSELKIELGSRFPIFEAVAFFHDA